ncbi:hypothetical protein Tco_0393656 [Tanacetum coccineum]
MSAKDTIAVQHCGLSAKELNKFLSFYPIPLEYDVILSTSTQTIFDAPPGYVGLYTHSFSLANLRLPLTDFFCELDSKSFRDKLPPNIDENPYFQRLGRYPTSVHVFDDPILFLVGLKPLWEFGQQRPAIIMGGKEMAFRNFIYTEDDDDLAFLPKEPSPGFGIGSLSTSVNKEPPKDVEEPKVQPTEVTAESGESSKADVFVVHPGSVAARIKEMKCKTRGGSVVPYAAMELVHSDELGRLVGKLVSFAITYGRCRAYEQVVAIKEPFDLSKVKGYRSSYQKEHTQASNDFSTAMFPWLDEFVVDAAAPIEALLSKKPPILQKPAPSRTLMHVPSSQKATPSYALSVNLITPPADLSKPSPPPLE